MTFMQNSRRCLYTCALIIRKWDGIGSDGENRWIVVTLKIKEGASVLGAELSWQKVSRSDHLSLMFWWVWLSLSLSDHSLGHYSKLCFVSESRISRLSPFPNLDSISSFSPYFLSSNAILRYYPFVCATIQVPELTTIDLNIGTDTIDHYVLVESGSTSKLGRCCRILWIKVKSD